MDANALRQSFLTYFRARGHEVVKSAPLVPQNDPTLYFTNAGMVQFKDVFLGNDPRDYSRATTSQKCLRVSGKHNDLENVGRTPRHHTFFEMLGNFSFGDYFKKEAIDLAWGFLTVECGIDTERLWVTVFEEDDEAEQLWLAAGVPAERIQRLGAKDNFWSMGDTGPCGPCTEIHYDHGEHLDPAGGGPATESARYVEIWNLVFMQYDQDAEGNRTPLPNPSIDTGMGLERIAAVLQGVYSNYDTDLFQPIIARIAEVAGTPYGSADDTDVSLRVIADHARATAFLVADGVMPSNVGRGYVLRRVMRRAIRFGVKLGLDELFFHHATASVIDAFGETYPELTQRRSFIEEVVKAEEDRFRRTLSRGMRLLDDAIAKVGTGGTIDGDTAFELSGTYGFPLDLTQLIAEEQGVTVDTEGYEAALEAEKQRSREQGFGSGEEAIGELWFQLAQEHGETEFTGYASNQGLGTVVALVRTTDAGHQVVDVLEPGDKGVVLVDRTPLYAESGGQVGDTGSIAAGAASFTVSDTQKAAGLHLHHGELHGEALSVGDAVQLSVDSDERDQTRKNHTATHLLHAALREVLGEHVTQKGSLVGPSRLRFDFSHHKPMSADELRRVEDRVYQKVLADEAMHTEVMDLDAAKDAGAMALFGEKYDDRVRVLTLGDGTFSVELCGGTHVSRTGEIGLFRIVSESGVAAGVRRIEAQTGTGALAIVRDERDTLEAASAELKTEPARLLESVRKLREEKRKLEKELAELEREKAQEAAGDLVSNAVDVGGVKVLAARYDGDLLEQADRLRSQLGSALVILAGEKGGKVQLLVAVTKDVAGKRAHAGKVLQDLAPLVGGRGGGRPDMARGGGSDPAGIEALVAAAFERAGSYVNT